VKRVFVDTSAFFALVVHEDECHTAADLLFSRAARQGWDLVTTNAVVFECYALLLNRARQGRMKALAFLDSVEDLAIERLTPEDERAAARLVRAHEDKTYSLCDASSFVIMERLAISEALSFDDDFRSYGRFTILTAE
jgi:uncharacterized protein